MVVKKTFILILIIIFALVLSCTKKQEDLSAKGKNNIHKNKVLVIHSYHEEHKGVIENNEALMNVFKETDLDIKILYMDTQRNNNETFKIAAARMAKGAIETYVPDVVITFDDNAFKYVIMPYYRDAELPVVFAGIDWDASVYGAPYSNTTGIVSVALVLQMLDYLKAYTKGNRIAWLGYDTLTGKKETHAYREILGITMTTSYVNSFAEWKKTFVELQDKTDLIIQSGILIGMKDWDEKEAAQFVIENVKIPVGTINRHTLCCSLFGLVKVISEQGKWVAQTAIEILNGKKPSDIPVIRNKEGEILINLDIAEKLDITFDTQILKNAHLYYKDN